MRGRPPAPVDLARERRLRALDAEARKLLRDPALRERTNAWLADLEREEHESMARRETQTVTIRIETEILDRVDAYGERLERVSGLRVSRNGAIRALLLRGLNAEADGGARPARP